MSIGRLTKILRLVYALLWLGGCSLLWGSEYHGQVTLGGAPVPGATVTATQAGKKMATVTDLQGNYTFADLADGTWTVQVEMTGFAATQQEVAVAKDGLAGKWELKLLSLEEMRAAVKVIRALPPPVVAVVAAVAAPKAAGDGKAAPVAAPPSEAASAASDGLLINGSVNNAATSQFALAQGFGNSRTGGKSLYTGGIGVIFENSALDAKPFSLTGLDTAKPAYNHVIGIATLGGPIRIPHLLLHGPNFFMAYQWTRIKTDTTASALVPDAAERTGNLAELPVTIINPVTGVAYPGNKVPISPQALALLNLYPLPNLAGSTRYNYQVPLVGNTHQDGVQTRADKGIGRKDTVNGGFSLQSTRADSLNLFGFRDATNALGMIANVSWSHRLGRRIFLDTGYRFSRSSTRVTPYFANRTNVSGAAGITGNDQDAAYWGPPSLSFSSGIAGLSDAQSSFNRSETNAISETATWNRVRHNISVGGDFRRQEFNYLSQQNPRGSFAFTGAATQGMATTGGTSGSDFADFLIGLPDTSSIAFGNADKYLRQNVYDAFITDDWRIRPELTANIGVRWEYGAPITELFNRLVNLDATQGFGAVAPVLASTPVGSLTGQSYPHSLLRPDRLGIEPRIGVSWRPIAGSTVLVKAGYGIYDDTSVYQSSALQLAQQTPLSKSLTVANSAACPLTLASGFNPCSSITSDTFAVDPNFRVGYAQTWQLSVQRDLPQSIQMTATYNGIKGNAGECSSSCQIRIRSVRLNVRELPGGVYVPGIRRQLNARVRNSCSCGGGCGAGLRRRCCTRTRSLSMTIRCLGGQGPVAAGVTTTPDGGDGCSGAELVEPAWESGGFRRSIRGIC